MNPNPSSTRRRIHAAGNPDHVGVGQHADAESLGLFGIYTRLFESGRAKTEQSQLARALLQTLTDDLRSAIQDATTKPRLGKAGTGGATTVRRFGLFGSATELRFDALQITCEQSLPVATEESPPDADRASMPQVPELRTIVYTFVPPLDPNEETESEDTGLLEEAVPLDLPGLTRRELDFETPSRKADNSRFSASDSLDTTGSGVDTEDAMLLDDEPLDPTVTWIPEVVGLAFRYFDGRGWASSWDSLRRKSLPVAIEVRMQIESFDRRDHQPTRLADEASDEVDYVGAEGPSTLETDETDAVPTRRRTYRLVVDLPTAASYRGAHATTGRSGQSGVRAVVPRALRQPSTPVPEVPSGDPPSRESRPSDQWLRTDSQ